jgi:branched-chain amino acid aminotransferase
MEFEDLLISNRSFLYGDGFFESFKLIDGVCERFHLHYQRIQTSLDILQMVARPEWNHDFFVNHLRNASKAFNEKELRAKIVFYRESKGSYLPDLNSANFYLRLDPYVPLLKTELTAGIYTLAKKPVNFLSPLKTTSALMMVMAAKFAQSKGWDEVVLLNEFGRVCEGLTSNIFLKQNNKYATPPLSEGCIDGVNRKAFLQAHPEIIERPIEVEELKGSEIFFSNAVRGMLPVKLIQ